MKGYGFLIRRGLGVMTAAVVAVLVGLVPAVASAQAPVATAVLYEVAEALQFKGPKAATSPEAFKRRLADATLLGKQVQGAPGSAFEGAQFMIAGAKSSVSLTTGVGPIDGTFDILNDLDPTRNSLDTLLVIASGTLRGKLDLTTAQQGYAQVDGQYAVRGQRTSARGTFQGVFLIPFQVPAPGLEDQYFYLDLGPTAGTCDGRMALPIGPGGALVPVCPLASFEFSLGIPLTKAVLVLFD